MIAKLSEHRTQVTILLVSLIIVIVGAFLLRAAADDSLTIDEIFYVHTGVCAFNAGLVDLEPTNPPGPKLLAGIGAELSRVPADTRCTADTYQTLMPNPSVNNLQRLVFLARIPAILVMLALILVSAMWAFQLGAVLPRCSWRPLSASIRPSWPTGIWRPWISPDLRVRESLGGALAVAEVPAGPLAVDCRPGARLRAAQ